jgi:hypothetical protein
LLEPYETADSLAEVKVSFLISTLFFLLFVGLFFSVYIGPQELFEIIFCICGVHSSQKMDSKYQEFLIMNHLAIVAQVLYF